MVNPLYAPTSSLEAQATIAATLIKHEKKIDEAYLRNRFLIITTHSDEKINNIDTSHYTVQLDKRKFVAFIKEVLPPIAQDMGAKPEDVMWDTESEKALNEMADTIQNSKLDVWIGKSDDMLYKMDIHAPIETKPTYSTESIKMDIKISIIYKDYNKPMNIIAPEGAKTIEQLSTEYMQSDTYRTPSDLSKKSRDSTRLADMSTLRRALDASIASGQIKKLPVCRGGKQVLRCTSSDPSLISNLTILRNTQGRGWIPLDISDYFATSLPVDPSNNQIIVNSSGNEVTAAYYFRSDGTDYKIATYLEDPSNTSYTQGDGGSDPEMFEVGTSMTNEFGI